MTFPATESNALTGAVIGAAIEVHRELGPGKREAAYERALQLALTDGRVSSRVQVPVPVVYKGVKLDCGYRVDLLVEEELVVEGKSVEALVPVHRAQVLTQLRLLPRRLGLLINFNVPLLKEGVERLVEDRRRDALTTEERRDTEKEITDHSGGNLSGAVIGAAMTVHSELGPGLLASAYLACLRHELSLREVPFQSPFPLPLSFHGQPLGETDEVALLAGAHTVVQPLAVDALKPLHEACLLSQLRLGGWAEGLLLNFNTVHLRDGIRRVLNAGATQRRNEGLNHRETKAHRASLRLQRTRAACEDSDGHK